MNVILYEPALELLLDSQEGVVGQYIERKAARVLDQAKANARAYFSGAPAIDIERDVVSQMEGSTAVVAIVDGGSKSRRLAKAEREGTVRVGMRQALEAAR